MLRNLKSNISILLCLPIVFLFGCFGEKICVNRKNNTSWRTVYKQFDSKCCKCSVESDEAKLIKSEVGEDTYDILACRLYSKRHGTVYAFYSLPHSFYSERGFLVMEKKEGLYKVYQDSLTIELLNNHVFYQNLRSKAKKTLNKKVQEVNERFKLDRRGSLF